MSTIEDGRRTIAKASSAMPLEYDFDNVLLLAAVAGAVMSVPLLGPIAFADLGGLPPPALNWIAFALAAPPLLMFVFQDPGGCLPKSWCVLWSAAFLAFCIQLLSGPSPLHLSSFAHPPRLYGFYVSNVLLAALWGGSIVLAWTKRTVLWPQAAMVILLSASALVTTVGFDPGVPRTCGLLFAIVLAGTVAVRAICFQTESAAAQASVANAPLPPSVTAALLLRQVWSDANGKEVQIAATYSYLWLADQFGHVGLGLILCLIFTKVGALLGGNYQPDSVAQLAGLLVTVTGVCLWEYRAYHDAIEPPPVRRRFEADERMIRRNAEVAALYMVIGAGMGWAFGQDDALKQIAAFVALLFVAVVSAKYWVRQKIIWQKAGLPYLFRLSDAQHTIEEGEAIALQNTIEAVAPPIATAAPSNPRQVVIAGPIGSGRTKLAAGLGTELAFRRKSVRYVSLDRLIEFAEAPGATNNPPVYADDLGPVNIGYWPWVQAEVLIIDDIGPVLNSRCEHDMTNLLEEKLHQLQPCLQTRHTVWVLGDLGSGNQGREKLMAFAKHIHTFCGGTVSPTAVLLHLGGRAQIAA